MLVQMLCLFSRDRADLLFVQPLSPLLRIQGSLVM